MANKKTIVATTISATLALIMMTTVAPAEQVQVTTVQPAVNVIPSDARLEKWFKFQRLAKEWKEQRGIHSSIAVMSTLPAYQSIIGMGEDAVPLIVAQLKLEGDDPDQWFWALKFITQADPVKLEDRGDFASMAKTWTRWAEDEGYAG